MSKLEKQIEKLLTVGEVKFYRVVEGGYGVSVHFYDDSYILSVPSDTLSSSVEEMLEEWHIQAALKSPKHLIKAYKEYIEELLNSEESSND